MRRAPLPDGGALAYEVAGAGPPLLLIRPLGGSIALWGGFRDRLAARARVIAFDARGSGGSSRPRVPTTTRSMAADARALLDHLGVAACDVFGISLGGMVATWLAIDAPARVRRLVLASTLPRARAAGVIASARGAARGAALGACFLRGSRAAAACLGRQILSARFRAEHPDEAARIEASLAADGLSRAGALAQLAAAAGHDACARLPEIAAPTLVLRGGRDPLITPASQRALLARIPDVTFEVIEDAGHALTLERPVETAARVAAFLES